MKYAERILSVSSEITNDPIYAQAIANPKNTPFQERRITWTSQQLSSS